MEASERESEREGGRERWSKSVKEAGSCISWRREKGKHAQRSVAVFMNLRLKVLSFFFLSVHICPWCGAAFKVKGSL